MKNFDTRTYSIADIEEWSTADLLDLSPEFQRRSVWRQPAKSYLIDTILRGRPIPKMIFTQRLEGRRNLRTVVDGQQRLRTILEFLDDGFPVSRAHNQELAGFHFSDLSDEQQRAFRKYELGVDLLFDVSYEDMLDIFTRLNAYTVPLSREEKLNASYVGYFKQAVFRAGHQYAEYWLNGKVLRDTEIARMAEAALASDLLILILDGPQSNKVVDSYYEQYEEQEGNISEARDRIDRIMSVIAEVYPPEDLAKTHWAKTVQFYTLFGALAAIQGLVSQMQDIKSPKLTSNTKSLRVKLDDFSVRFGAYHPDALSPHIRGLEQYVELSRRRTADKASREYRVRFLAQALAG